MSKYSCTWCGQPCSTGFCPRPHPDYNHTEARRRGVVAYTRARQPYGTSDDVPVREVVERRLQAKMARLHEEMHEIVEKLREYERLREGHTLATELRCPRCSGRVVMEDGVGEWCQDCAFIVEEANAS